MSRILILDNSVWIHKAVVAGPAGPVSAGPLFWPYKLSAFKDYFKWTINQQRDKSLGFDQKCFKGRLLFDFDFFIPTINEIKQKKQ